VKYYALACWSLFWHIYGTAGGPADIVDDASNRPNQPSN